MAAGQRRPATEAIQPNPKMFPLKNDLISIGPVSPPGSLPLILLSMLLLGAACSSVDPTGNRSSASSASVSSDGPTPTKKNDFYSIMTRMDNTSHSAPR